MSSSSIAIPDFDALKAVSGFRGGAGVVFAMDDIRSRPITPFEELVCSWRRPRSRTRHCQVSGQSACVHRMRRAGKRGEDHGGRCAALRQRPGANVSRLWRLALPAVCAATFVNETGLTRNRDAPNRAISAKNCSIHVDFLLSKIPLNIVALP